MSTGCVQRKSQFQHVGPDARTGKQNPILLHLLSVCSIEECSGRWWGSADVRMLLSETLPRDHCDDTSWPLFSHPPEVMHPTVLFLLGVFHMDQDRPHLFYVCGNHFTVLSHVTCPVPQFLPNEHLRSISKAKETSKLFTSKGGLGILCLLHKCFLFYMLYQFL